MIVFLAGTESCLPFAQARSVSTVPRFYLEAAEGSRLWAGKLSIQWS